MAERTLTAERSLALERARAARAQRELLEAEAEVVAEERLEASGSARRERYSDPLELLPSASLPRLDSLDRRLRALRSEHRSAEERLEQLRDELDARTAHPTRRPLATTLTRCAILYSYEYM